MTSFSEVLTYARLQALTDTRTFARGNAYFHEGAVDLLSVVDGTLRATVEGSYVYRVELGRGPGADLTYGCDCPVGEEGVLCKHVVAVGLAWLDNPCVLEPLEQVKRVPVLDSQSPSEAEHLQQYLATLDAQALRHRLFCAAMSVPSVGDQLLFEADAAAAHGFSELAELVMGASNLARLAEFDDVDVAQNSLKRLVSTLEEWLTGALAPHVAELAELSIVNIENTRTYLDVYGLRADVGSVLKQLAALHRRACEQQASDPQQLAERLFRLQTAYVGETFATILPAYQTALGTEGLRRYRDLLQAADQPVQGRGAVPTTPRIEQALLALAEMDGDIDAWVRIKTREMSWAQQYVDVVEHLLRHARVEDAGAWAERGLDRFERHPALLTYAIEHALRRGETLRADTLAWRRFVEGAGPREFAELLAIARQTGSLDAVRQQALSHLRGLASQEEAAAKQCKAATPSRARGTLVLILIEEGDLEAAWATFNAGLVPAHLWRRMADARAKTHPHDAIALYQRLLPDAVRQGLRTAAYEEAFELVCVMRRLRATLGEEAIFAQELAHIKKTYSNKRNFMRLLHALEQRARRP